MAAPAQAPDVVAVLQAIQSANPDERNAATMHLEQAQANPDGYVQAMVGVLHYTQNPVSARQIAAVCLNSLFVTRQEAQRAAFEGRWTQVQETTKASTRQVLLNALSDPDENIRHKICLALSRIMILDLKLRSWPDAIPRLLSLANDKSRAETREAALRTLGYVCEEVSDTIVADHFSNMLQSIYDAVQPGEPSMRIRLVGMQALANGLDFLEGTMQQEHVRDRLLSVIEGAATAPDNALREVALSTLARTVEVYYENLTRAWMERLCLLSLSAMKDPAENVAKQGFDFWASLAQTEAGLLDADELGVEAGRPKCQGYVAAAAAAILPTVLEGMKRTEQDELEEEYDVADEADWCLGCVARLAPAAAVAAVVPFIVANIQSQHWQERSAAVTSFGWLVDAVDSKTATPLISSHIFAVAKHVSDPVGTVRGAVAWATGKVIEVYPESLLPQYTNDMIDAGMALLHDSIAAVAVRGAALLDYVALFFKSTGDTRPPTSELSAKWTVAVEALVRGPTRHPSSSKLLSACYEAVNDFVEASANDCEQFIIALLPQMVDRLVDAVKRMRSGGASGNHAAIEQGNLCAVVGCIVNRLIARSDVVLQQSDRILESAYYIFHTKPDSVSDSEINNIGYIDEALTMLSSIATCLGEGFGRYISHVAPMIDMSLVQYTAPDTVRTAAGCAEAVVEAMGELLGQDVLDSLTSQLILGLESPVLSAPEKPALVSVLQTILTFAPNKAMKNIPNIMRLLKSASALSAESATQGPPSHETVNILSRLRSNVAACYSALFLYSNRTVAEPYLSQAVEFAETISGDPHRTDECLVPAINMLRDSIQCAGAAAMDRLATQRIQQLVQVASASSNPSVKEAAEDLTNYYGTQRAAAGKM